MANRIKIQFPSNPTAFYLLSFSVFNIGLGYSHWISKTFVTGTPTTSNQVKIAGSLSGTLQNLLDNLNANNVDLNVVYSSNSINQLIIEFRVPETYSYNIMTDPGSTVVTFSTETIVLPINDVLPSLNLKHISIRLFDTYTNDRILVEELASSDACKINWDSGDDLYKSLMTSNLVFNMLVPTAEDAHFIHLFSGDEKRYRVEVVAIDDVANEQLVWQGYLLPDQYNEPYKNVSFFVDFTATDMIASLKGKYFPQWYYKNSFPVGKLLSYVLSQTGLDQNIIVKPSVVPADPILGFENIVVNLEAFYNDGKAKDLNEILDTVLKSLGCTLYNYRGYWWVEGVTRRKDVVVSALQFDLNGDRIQDIEVAKNVVDCNSKLQPVPNIVALTPFKLVSLPFKPTGTKNLYSDNVVLIEDSVYFKTSYTTGNYSGPGHIQNEVYTSHLLNNWKTQLNSDFLYLGMVGRQLIWKIINPSSYNFNYTGYNYTAAMSLMNYIECSESPFVKKGTLYEFSTVLKVEKLNFDADNKDVTNKLKSGVLDNKIFPFQIFIDEVEKYSNRQGFDTTNLYRYTHTDESTEHRVTALNILDGYDHDITFTLKFNFRPENDGLLSFRILMPVVNNADKIRVGGDTVYKCESLKLAVVDGLEESEDTLAVRPINYTQELDYELGISCTQDNSVLNSIALNRAVNQNFFKTISRADMPYNISGWHYYAPATDLELRLSTWKITDIISSILFRKRLIENCFLRKASGEEIPFTSLWVFFNNPVSRMGYLRSYDGFPNIPKTYKAYPSVATADELKYMYVEYPDEDYKKRLNWKLFGLSSVDTFPKTLAKALHGVRPDVSYRLEANSLVLLFPDSLIDFYFENNDRNFIPTKLTLDLFAGKTSFVATEAKFTELIDITYE